MASGKNWQTEPVAVVGMSCRAPGGSNSPSKLWNILRDPPDLRKEIPLTKFNYHSFYHPEGARHGTSNVSHSYVLEEDVGKFDHGFFNINPKEAESMDPQQRLLLETVYEGIEAAGYAMSDLRGSPTGVFVGQMTDDYYEILDKDVPCAPQYTATGTSRAIVANRVSYFFDWRGPSVNIDTACSSSLVALHQAVQSLRSGETSLAVVAGVNLILGPEKYIFESQLSMLSPTGCSRMWDANADGYARGEGVASVVLKKLSQALADNDHIECIIRETGVNQDGRSEGLTVPSSEAQVALIRSTYEKCGLDWRKMEDRCQYFEAHGTGTQAGDPKEARAIRDAFFSPDADGSSKDTLFVGSIKTVIGHLEGAAGLAGLLKAALAVQHGLIPPNLHFNHLNPKIRPFYDNLEVPTRLQPWPKLPKNVPRRVSINSFGFGGTNAHAIVESWDPPTKARRTDGESQSVAPSCSQHFGPFVLSANSQQRLMVTMSNLARSLQDDDDDAINLEDLAWTLQHRREHFPVRAAIAALDKHDLVEQLFALSKDANALSLQCSNASPISAEYPIRILGIFTGQGAQWPRMGSVLYNRSACFRKSINELQLSLSSLPDGPSWTLDAELLAPPGTSRVMSAEIAQPICTAVQIALVDLLRVAGISLDAVVGHSSGEIAAAYAAGYLSAGDGIRIAYYRGLHSHLASSPNGQPGKMMAVGMSFDDAVAFCQRPRFRNSISVAASNSVSSVTISGDADAILEAKEVLGAEGIFARVLQVDKAYHPHHMRPCAEAYLQSLRDCAIKVLRSDVVRDCVWYSSVYGPAGSFTHQPSLLADQYWVDNLLKPVLFSQALERAIKESQRFNLVLEVGPHPALRGPASDLINSLAGIPVPYSGLLRRGEDDLVSLSAALGFVWRHVQCEPQARPVPDFEAFARACQPDGASFNPRVCKSMPTFPWDHGKSLMWESRASKLWRGRREPEHDLLGLKTVSVNRQEVQWRKIMRADEMDWLRGHKFQNQILFPAAGYVSMAVEAALDMVSDQNSEVDFIQLNDLHIHRAITLSEQSPAGTEVRFSINARHPFGTSITADFSCFSVEADAGVNEQSHLNFSGSVCITTRNSTDENSAHSLRSPRKDPELPLDEVELGGFYASVSDIGLDYSGDFVASSIRRRLGFATVTMSQRERTHLRLDPAVLDVSFQGLFAAFCAPGDGRMWTAYLPTSIRRITLTPRQYQNSLQSKQKHFIADCELRAADDKIISADVKLYSAADNTVDCQLEGLTCSSFTAQSPENDRKLFSRTVWKKDVSCGIDETRAISTVHDETSLHEAVERTSYFFLRRLRDEVSASERETVAWHFKASLEWVCDRLLPSIEAGEHPRIKRDWASDTEADIRGWQDKFGDEVTLRAVHAIGRNYPDIVRGIVPALQVLMEDDVLNRIYKEGIGAQSANTNLGELVGQLAHRYPRMNILEIGAGTGGTTHTSLKYLKSAFASYTYTDISPGFFERAASVFSSDAPKMVFKTLNIERDPVEQGFQEQSFDLILASNVIHATKHLETSVANCRRLLRPGGYMILLEVTSESLWPQTVFSALPGWWLGQDEGRINHPTVSISEWDGIVRRCGFSGVDKHYRDIESEDTYTYSVFSTQAMDDRVQVLRNPLLTPPGQPLVPTIHHLTLLGPSSPTSEVRQLLAGLQEALSPFAGSVKVAHGLGDPTIARDSVPLGGAVVSIIDLQEACFRNMDSSKFQTLKAILTNSKNILWATSGLADDPYANIMVGLGRTVMTEQAHLNLQFVRLVRNEPQNVPQILSSMLLRMLCIDLPGFNDLLWSAETETMVEDGDLYIPRILHDEDLNHRLNSGRRTIHGKVNLSQQAVTLKRESGTGVRWLEHNNSTPSAQRDVEHGGLTTSVRVQVSSLFPVVLKDGTRHFVCVGQDANSDKPVLALTASNSSLVTVPSINIVTLQSPGSRISRQVLLQTALVSMVCEGVMRPLADVKGTVWLHDADPFIAEVASSIAAVHGLQLFWTDSRGDTKPLRAGGQVPAIIDPFITDGELRNLVPHNAHCLVTVGGEFTAGFHHRLASCLAVPNAWHLGSQADCHGRIPVALSLEEALQSLKATADGVPGLSMSSSGTPDVRPVAVPVNELAANGLTAPHTSDPFELVDWESVEWTTAVVKPLNTNGLFAGNKTYWLVGLTGELGVGLCNWMIDNGAQHFVLSSRSPAIDGSILRHWQRRGVHVRVLALDVSDEEMVRDVHKQIVDSMPPVGGVMNGAMVLRDRVFSDMTLEDFNAALTPKVKGSENLDRIFRSDPLEFFIFFSSLSCVSGSAGQSNYAAANMAMISMAAQRRARGVAASVIDIGILSGFGWIWRVGGEKIEAQLKAFGFMSIPEPEFHTVIAEAIETGRPEKDLDPELHVGLAMMVTESRKRCPRFSHLIPSENQAAAADSTSRQSEKSALQLIAEETSDEGILGVIEKSISRKLASVLQLPDTGSPIDPSTPILSLGIDSLVAVELRSWFLKELAVDVPTLRILSEVTIADISVEVKSKLGISSNEPETGPAAAGISATTVPDQKTPSTGRSISASTNDDKPAETVQSVSIASSTIDDTAYDNSDGTTTPSDSDTQPDSLPTSFNDSTTEAQFISSSIHTQIDSFVRTGPMSHSQEALHFLHEYLHDKSSQNVLLHARYPHRLDMARFDRALQLVASRHEALRSAYFVDKTTQQATQGVTSVSGIRLIHRKMDSEGSLDAEIMKLRKHVFDIANGESMVVSVYSISPTLHHIIFVHHHIVMDAQAIFIFLTELTAAYGGQPLGDSPPQCIDACIQMRADCAPENVSERLSYWEKTQLPPMSPIALFPFATVRSRKPLQDYDTHTFDISLDAELCSLIRRKCTDLLVTPFHFYLATLRVLLARCLGSNEDVNIGIVDSNRRLDVASRAVGCFVGLFPVRIRLDRDESFNKLALRSRDTVIEALANAGLPFEMILDHLKVPRHSTNHPLFQVLLNYRLGVPESSPLGDGKMQWVRAIPAQNSYDLVVEVSDTPRGGCILSFTTQRYMYSAADSQMLMKWYMHLLKTFALDAAVQTQSCPLAEPREMDKSMTLGRGPTVNVSWEGTLVDQVTRAAAKFPDSIAIKDDDGGRVTYEQMMDIVNQLCKGLHESSIPQGSRVAVLLPPNAGSICTLLAILRQGSVWVPLDIRNPPQRLAAILEDCQPQRIIHSAATADLVREVLAKAGHKPEPLLLEDLMAPATTTTLDPPANLSQREAEAVLLYTSGSTGVPKGVRLTHIGLLNQVFVLADSLTGRQVVLQQTSHGFDMALDQIFTALAHGGMLIVVGSDGRGDPKHISQLMLSEGVTYTFFVPSEYHMLLQHGIDCLKQCHQWRQAHAGGEKITHHLLKAFRALGLPQLQVINGYGPTETHVTCARGLVPYHAEEEDITTGKDTLRVLPNYSVIIVDENRHPVPAMFPGEICISSPYCISPGYVRSQLNKDLFTNSELIHAPGPKWPVYRTGDLGRLMEDGTLTVLGRIESQATQVKIRGQRVELDEIAATIVRCANNIISNAAVSWRSETETLVALVVLQEDSTEEAVNWVTHRLRDQLPLPLYMRPSCWIPVEAIPTNSNGKADRRAIDEYPIPSRESQQRTGLQESFASLSSVEIQVAKIWEQALGDQCLDIGDADTDFFYAGGNSRSLIEVRTLLESKFAPVKVNLPQLFQNSSLRDMAALVAPTRHDGSAAGPSRIDWNAEITEACEQATRSLDVSRAQSGSPAHRGLNSLVVVLTGATGFLGSAIAQELVNDARVREVHCIAIRSTNKQARRVPVQSDKIFEYAGDLESPDLGLSVDDFRTLSNRADLIIHVGAEVSFLKTYNSLRRANVYSTVQLCRMALIRSIPIHFVSTGSVALVPLVNSNGHGKMNPPTLLERSASDRMPLAESQSGYQDTKWVAEQVLERLSTQHGLPVTIHRPASIIGAGAPKLDWMAAILNTSKLLKKVPALEEKIEGFFDLVPVQDISSRLVNDAIDAVKSGQHKEGGKLKFVHHCADTKLSPGELKKYLEREDDSQASFSVVPLNVWMDAAARVGMEPLIHEFLTSAFAGTNKLTMPSMS
ncbi:beta-ketoacyl synthase domain-containing protein [Colletotrichum somersetense]|nr:beta-ketoacyl synthase domain-containing protein [Colletotrichum somersetense]